MGAISDDLGDGVMFTLKLVDKGQKRNREYCLRARNLPEAEKWIAKLTACQDDAAGSVILEEDEAAELTDMDINLISSPSSSLPTDENGKDGTEAEKGKGCQCCSIQ